MNMRMQHAWLHGVLHVQVLWHLFLEPNRLATNQEYQAGHQGAGLIWLALMAPRAAPGNVSWLSKHPDHVCFYWQNCI